MVTTTTKSELKQGAIVPELVVRGPDGNARHPQFPRALCSATAAALKELKTQFPGVSSDLDGFADAVVYQAYLERGKKLLAMHHLNALHGRLDRSALRCLCAELQAVVSLCEKNIKAENHAVRSLNASSSAAALNGEIHPGE